MVQRSSGNEHCYKSIPLNLEPVDYEGYDDPVDRALRIRAHRARVEREMKALGLFVSDPGALKICSSPGCLAETVNIARVIIRQGWTKNSKGKWRCPQCNSGKG